MSKEAMKRTVDKIKSTFWEGYLPEPVKCKYPKCSYPCSDLPDCRDAQKALDKKAENARELGLDYEPAQQEPVAYIHRQGNHYEVSERFLSDDEKSRGWTEEPLYTFPPAQRTWVGLTDKEMNAALDYWSEDERSAYGGAHAADGEYVSMIDTWRYIEAKLKEKNNG